MVGEKQTSVSRPADCHPEKFSLLCFICCSSERGVMRGWGGIQSLLKSSFSVSMRETGQTMSEAENDSRVALSSGSVTLSCSAQPDKEAE